jgi:glucokinase
MKAGMTSKQIAVGVDIGGSHITAALIDIERKGVIPETVQRATVNANGAAEEILSQWFDAIETLIVSNGIVVERIGFAMPGPFDYEQGISLIRNLHKYDTLYGFNIKDRLAAQFGIDKSAIKMRNDTEAFLDGEMMSGAGKGYRRSIGITLGTGLGSARSNQGITEDVNLGSAPFKAGIADEYLSTRWFVRKYQEYTGKTVAGVKELLEMQDDKSRYTSKILEEFCDNLAAFLRSFITAENPEIVIIGGNIAQSYGLFYPLVSRLLNEYDDRVVFKKAELAEAAALLGAVSDWMDK